MGQSVLKPTGKATDVATIMARLVRASRSGTCAAGDAVARVIAHPDEPDHDE